MEDRSKVCRWCREDFVPTGRNHWRQLHCSSRCVEARRKYHAQKVYRCELCGSVYIGVRGSRGASCAPCRDEHRRIVGRRPEKQCRRDGCSEMFRARTSERFCSPECRDREVADSRRNLVSCNFVECGKEFFVNTGERHANQRFCDSECRRKHRALERRDEWRSMSQRKRRDLRLKKLYGVSIEWADAKLKEQGGRCGNPGCGRQEAGGRWGTWHLDHCHETGLARGLLCDNCNKALGLLRDSHEVISGLALYASNHAQLRLAV